MTKPIIGVFHQMNSDEEIHIDVSRIESYKTDTMGPRKEDIFTTIRMRKVTGSGYATYHVKETPAEILQIIKEA